MNERTGTTPRSSLCECARRVADAAAVLLDHDAECREFACLMRDGCEVRVVLMDTLNAATNDYIEAKTWELK